LDLSDRQNVADVGPAGLTAPRTGVMSMLKSWPRRGQEQDVPEGQLGDAEALQRLRERATDTVTRPAGSTELVDADIGR
jgi:hypothetical protein